MASSALTKLVLVVALCMVMSAPIAHAITCNQVSSSLAPCINYVRGAGPLPANCCAGVRSLNSQATTTPDRRTACNCLKSLTGSIKGMNPALAAGLPGKCGVSIPYKISPSTNCATVK